MATTLNITSSFAGVHAGKYISASLLSANTILKGGVEVRPNIKFKEIVSKLATDDLLKDGTCDFTATSTVTKTERILEPKELQVNLQLCRQTLRQDWDAVEMGVGIMNDNMPKTFQDYLIGHVAEKVAAAIEVSIWRGVDGAGQFDGFATLLATDADLPAAQEVASTSVTAANVIDELGKIVDAIPASLYGKEDLHIYVSQNIYRSYVRALGGFQSGGQGANGFRGEGNNQSMGDLVFDGVKLFVANGLADNTAICAEKSNLFFGTALLSEMQEISILDMRNLDGSQNIRYVQRFSAGVQYGNVEDIVTYGITNAAN
jgi:hypothetical protein